MAAVHITVDPDLAEIMPRYMELSHGELDKIKEAVAQGDAETVRLIGHRFKGTGTSYGMPQISELGLAIELAGKERDLPRASVLADELRGFLNTVEIQYGEEM